MSSTSAAPIAPRSPKSYFVLIGGESCDTQGANLEKREYMHTSLFFVGKVHCSKLIMSNLATVPTHHLYLLTLSIILILYFSFLSPLARPLRHMISCDQRESPEIRSSPSYSCRLDHHICTPEAMMHNIYRVLY